MNVLKTICPNNLKLAIRQQHLLHEIKSPSSSVQQALDRSNKMWTAYEQVNRDFCPEDPVYSVINNGSALSTTADHLALQATPSGQGRTLEIIIGGEATASAVNRVAVQRAGSSYTGGATITPEKFNSRSPAAAGVYRSGGTQALVGNPMVTLAFNAFGGFIRWVAAPGEEIYYVNSELVSMRSLSGTSTCSSTIIFEEL